MLQFVYEEVDPRTDMPGYVGITNNPNQRHEQHLDDSSSNPQKAAWIQGLLKEGLSPKMRIIEIVEDRVKAEEREKYWIQTYEGQGIVLTNIEYSRTRKKRQKTLLTVVSTGTSTTPIYNSYDYEELEYAWELDGQEGGFNDEFLSFACRMNIYIACYCCFDKPLAEQKDSLHTWMAQKIVEYPKADQQEKDRLREDMTRIIYGDVSIAS